MVYDGNKGSFADNSFVKPGTSQQNLGVARSQGVQRGDSGKNFMEMEGRGYSDFYRNSSEELFIKTLMEGSVGMPAPTMETLGFKNNHHHNFRTDSEELFKSWLTNGENPGYNGIVHHRPRQASRRMFTDMGHMANASTHQNGVTLQRKRSNDNLLPQIPLPVDETSNDINEHSTRNMAEKGLQASNLYLAKAWFHSSQPMTRSRSSELRRRYVAMQNTQTAIGMEAMHNASGNGINHLKQEFHNPGGYNDGSVCDIPNQFNTFMSPSNSSSSTFNTPLLETVDRVSSVVSMLKGTLERKKLGNQIEKEAIEDNSLGYYGAQEIVNYSNLNIGQGNHFHEGQGLFQDISTAQVEDPRLLQTVEGTIDVDLESFMAPMNPIQINTASRANSQSESSAPVLSTGFDACDGPSNSGQTPSICESSRMQVGNGKSSENGSGAKDIRERMYDNLKEDRKKKGGLVRYGSVTSAGSVDKGDPTKKRRVERSRKMAEAKERTLTPVIPSDMQSILKRCENLEKEVRSLKLNLSFMNRKDSEQTKQIEELQKQNEELGEDKERLVEEIERIISETGKM